MEIITEKQLAQFGRQHADSKTALGRWAQIAKESQWKSLVEIRNSFRSADEVIVASGRPVVIFNIRGNAYRLITAVHYNRGLVYVMMFLTHAEYDKDTWKKSL